MALNTEHAGGSWKKFSQAPSGQDKPVVAWEPDAGDVYGGSELTDSQAPDQKVNLFSTWSKEKQDEYISGRKELLASMEKSGCSLSPYFQALKDGIESVDKGEKTWDQVYAETVEVSTQMSGPEEVGAQTRTPEVVSAQTRTPEVVSAQTRGPALTRVQARDPAARGPQAVEPAFKKPARQGIDLSGIRGDDNSLAVQEGLCR